MTIHLLLRLGPLAVTLTFGHFWDGKGAYWDIGLDIGTGPSRGSRLRLTRY